MKRSSEKDAIRWVVRRRESACWAGDERCSTYVWRAREGASTDRLTKRAHGVGWFSSRRRALAKAALSGRRVYDGCRARVVGGEWLVVWQRKIGNFATKMKAERPGGPAPTWPRRVKPARRPNGIRSNLVSPLSPASWLLLLRHYVLLPPKY